MQFKNVIGQAAVKQQLIKTMRLGRMPHAQLFHGPKGCGKLVLALACAQYLLCENPGETDSCGECRQCQKATKMIHPDLHYAYPTVGSKAISTHFLDTWREKIGSNPYIEVNQWLLSIGAENKQGNITRDECVDILKKFSFKTFEGNYKILVLWMPEYLAREGNRLLKLIEEPQPNTAFFLVAENQELILNTILSRCQLVSIPAIKDEPMITHLVSNHHLASEEATSIAYLANGSYSAALDMMDESVNDNTSVLLEWFRIAYSGNGAKMVEWVDAFARKGRENQKHFIDYTLHFLRELLIVKMQSGIRVRLQEQELDRAKAMAKVLEPDQVEAMMKILNDCYYHIERNAHPKVLMLNFRKKGIFGDFPLFHLEFHQFT